MLTAATFPAASFVLPLGTAAIGGRGRRHDRETPGRLI